MTRPPDANTSDTLWRFVRGDLDVQDFEAWLYANDQTLVPAFGEDETFTFLSLDFRDPHAVFALRERLEQALRTWASCECPSIRDEDGVDMGLDGLDERVFATVDEAARHGGKQWWLWLGKCRACAQDWLIASDERIYDAHVFARVTPETAKDITAHGRWPATFRTYEDVLRAASRYSNPCRFLDEFISLSDTAKELRRDRPDITHEDIAALIGVEPDHVPALLR